MRVPASADRGQPSLTEFAAGTAVPGQDRCTTISTQVSPVDAVSAPRDRSAVVTARGVTAANRLQDLTSAMVTVSNHCGNTGWGGSLGTRCVHDLQQMAETFVAYTMPGRP
jgi:hypothetical protein